MSGLAPGKRFSRWSGACHALISAGSRGSAVPPRFPRHGALGRSNRGDGHCHKMPRTVFSMTIMQEYRYPATGGHKIEPHQVEERFGGRRKFRW